MMFAKRRRSINLQVKTTDLYPYYMHSIRTLAFNQRLSELEVLEIDNPSCTAKIALQGAQILQFQPKQSAQPLLWLSSANSGKKGKALRGGIPLCFPWFGSHPQGLQPAHGFARNQLWTLQEVSYEAEQATHHVDFTLQDSPATRQIWAHAFRLKLRISCGETLNLYLQVENTGQKAFDFSFAWHSYFQVKQIQHTQIQGLQQAEFMDQLNHHQRDVEDQAVTFQQETDRIYPKALGHYRIEQADAQTISIRAPECDSVVVWNPWQAKAERLGDIVAGDWQRFVCVEVGQIAPQQVRLAAGAASYYQLQIANV